LKTPVVGDMTYKCISHLELSTVSKKQQKMKHTAAALGVTEKSSGSGGGGVGGLSDSNGSPSELANSSVQDFLVLAAL